MREKLIKISKEIVNEFGWNDRVLISACKELNISPVLLI